MGSRDGSDPSIVVESKNSSSSLPDKPHGLPQKPQPSSASGSPAGSGIGASSSRASPLLIAPALGPPPPDTATSKTGGVPVVVLATLFAVAVIAVKEDSYIHRILDSPDNYWVEVGRFVLLAVGGVVVSVLSLKCIIYGFSELCAVVVSLETKEQMDKKEKKGVPTRGLVLGGMIM